MRYECLRLSVPLTVEDVVFHSNYLKFNSVDGR